MKTIKNLTAEEIRKSILQLAIQGKLVKQDPSDEPASELVKRIYAEKQKLIREGKIKKDKNESFIFKGDDNCYYEKIGKNKVIKLENLPFEIPENWSWIRLSSFCDIYTGDSINENDKNKLYRNRSEGYDYIGTKDVNFNHTIVYENGVKIPYDTQFKICPKSKILLCIEGGSAGRKIAFTSKDVCFGNKLACFNSWIIDDRYLYLFLQSPLFLQLFKDKLTGIISGVSINNLKQLFLPLPPLEEQERIVEKFKSCEPLLSRYELIEQNITLLETSLEEKLKASILQYAIEGKLVKQDPNDEPASVLLERIKAEKEKLISEGKIKRDKNDSIIVQSDDKNYYENLPIGWSFAPLSAFGVYKKGPFGSSLTKAMFIDEKTPNRVKVYEQKNAIQHDYRLGNYYISSNKYEEMKGFSVYPCDIIVSCAGTIGEIYQLPNEAPIGIINQALMKITLFYNKIATYYIILLRDKLHELSKSAKGTAIKNIPSFDKLKPAQILIPPENEQKRIINRLNKIFDLFL